MFQRSRANEFAILHQMMLLRTGNQGAPAGLAHPQASREPGTIRSPEDVGVEADLLLSRPTDTTGIFPSITERPSDGAVNMTGQDPDRREDRSVSKLQLHDVGVEAAMLATVGVAAE